MTNKSLITEYGQLEESLRQATEGLMTEARDTQYTMVQAGASRAELLALNEGVRASLAQLMVDHLEAVQSLNRRFTETGGKGTIMRTHLRTQRRDHEQESYIN